MKLLAWLFVAVQKDTNHKGNGGPEGAINLHTGSGSELTDLLREVSDVARSDMGLPPLTEAQILERLRQMMRDV